MQVPTTFPSGKRSMRIDPGGFCKGRLRREIRANCFFVGETRAWLSGKQTTALEYGIRSGAGVLGTGDLLPVFAFDVDERASA